MNTNLHITTMMKPATKMMRSYQNSPSSIDQDEEIVATILSPSTTTRSYHSSKWRMIATSVAGMLLLVMLAGGTVWLWDGDDTTKAEGRLIVGINPAILRCHPARSVFRGKSTTYFGQRGQARRDVFWQYGNLANYCWSQSWYDDDSDGHPFLSPLSPITTVWSMACH